MRTGLSAGMSIAQNFLCELLVCRQGCQLLRICYVSYWVVGRDVSCSEFPLWVIGLKAGMSVAQHFLVSY